MTPDTDPTFRLSFSHVSDYDTADAVAAYTKITLRAIGEGRERYANRAARAAARAAAVLLRRKRWTALNEIYDLRRRAAATSRPASRPRRSQPP